MSWLEDKIKQWEESNDVGWLKTQLAELGDHINEYEKTARETESTLRAQLAAAEKERDEARSMVDEWADKCTKAESQLAAAKEENAALREQIASARAEVRRKAVEYVAYEIDDGNTYQYNNGVRGAIRRLQAAAEKEGK